MFKQKVYAINIYILNILDNRIDRGIFKLLKSNSSNYCLSVINNCLYKWKCLDIKLAITTKIPLFNLFILTHNNNILCLPTCCCTAGTYNGTFFILVIFNKSTVQVERINYIILRTIPPSQFTLYVCPAKKQVVIGITQTRKLVNLEISAVSTHLN